MREVKMVDIWELQDVIHQEEQEAIAKEVRKKSIRNAEKRKEREALLSGPTDYIDLLRKAKVPITATDIKEAIEPTKSKILEGLDYKERLVNSHALGHLHGLYVRMTLFSILFAIYMWL